jgi:hypothetical protein
VSGIRFLVSFETPVKSLAEGHRAQMGETPTGTKMLVATPRWPVLACCARLSTVAPPGD